VTDQRSLRVQQNLAQIDQLLTAMDTISQLVEKIRDETDALLKEVVV
jgi:hypothetical protein